MLFRSLSPSPSRPFFDGGSLEMPPPNTASVCFVLFHSGLPVVAANFSQQGTPSYSPTTIALESLSRSSIPSLVPVEPESAHDDNVSFLRSRSALHNPLLPTLSRHRRRRYQPPPHPRPNESEDQMDLDDPSTLRMSVEINRRIPIVRRQREESTNMPNYEGRLSNPRSLYGWAPGSDDEEENTVTAGQEEEDRKSTRLNSSHRSLSRMPSSA